MPTSLLAFILTLLAFQVKTQSDTLSYQILSQGENIEIALEDYFQSARYTQINYEKSTPDFNKKFDTKNTSAQNYREVFTRDMQFETQAKKKIKLSDLTYYTVKSLYNQPVKIFLLTNNFIMMLIYNEHCGGDPSEQNRVIGLNLTEKIPSDYREKNVTCTSMQTQTIDKDYVYVTCRAQQTVRTNTTYTFFIVQVNMNHSDQGFINGMQITKVVALINKTTSCYEYNLKYFQSIRLDKSTLSNKILIFCKNATYNSVNLVYYFYTLSQGIFLLTSDSLKQCLTNATYISPIDNGFISVINKQVSEYYSNQTKSQSQCLKTQLKNINHIFAASRTYNNIQITYFFLRNNTIIIKSSYRTNYQKFFVNCSGFEFTSYALTEHFMALSLSSFNGTTRLLVYQMEQLYPRLVDDVEVDSGQSYGNYLLMSTSNYLEKGFYIFVYNKSSNKLSLKQYNGYLLTITPISESLYLNKIIKTPAQSKLQLLSKRKRRNSMLGAPILKSPFPENSTVYTIYIQNNNSETSVNKSLIINIVVRNYNQTSISFYQPKPLMIDSHYINFNLSSLAVGPLQRFYIMENMSDSNIRLQFINYYSTINISTILQNGVAGRQQVRGQPTAIQKVKQIALNIQLKVLNPVFTLYYSTFIQNCILKYLRQKFEFSMQCNPNDIITFKSKIQFNSSKILVVTKDKWIQYNNQSLQLCTIIGESGQCQLLPINKIDFNIEMKRIKIVRFQSKISGNTEIQLFVICKSSLFYGLFTKQNKNVPFSYESIFKISYEEVRQLEYMELTNIHFDKNYNHYLLLHLSIDDGPIVKHMALLYDHPVRSNNGKFLGHLIRKFQDEQIQSIMTIDNLLMILYRTETGYTIIREYRITEFYSVYETRIYPLYGRKIVQNGSHVSDGEFLFIQAELQRKQPGKTEYLVYCPSLSTTNILTHVIPKQSLITFIQQIGSSKNKYPHSIGIHGQNIFSLSIPNLVIKFDYDAKTPNSQQYGLMKYGQGDVAKKKISGNMQLKLVDYNNIMHEISYQYQFDISAQIIEYNETNQQKIEINSSAPLITYELQPHKIAGPVMEVSLNTTCQFLQKDIQYQDLFTKTQCLIDIDSKMYGTLLDMTTVNLAIDKSVEIIVTTQTLMCVEDKKIVTKIQLPISKMCNIVSYEKGKGIFVCDEGQGSVINIFTFNETSCAGFNLKRNIAKPTWLIYQYFKMKFNEPFVVFEIPIRVQSNKIYFLTKYKLDTNQFSDKFSSLTNEQYDNFQTKDFQIFENYAYLLEDGLGIYNLGQQQNLNNTNVQPEIWIETEDIQKALNTSSEPVYIKPKPEKLTAYSQRIDDYCSSYSKSLHIQIGTTTHAYDVRICLTEDQFQGKVQFQIIPIIVYKQYKDCKNNVLSKSKTYSGLTIKLCVLQLQQHKIFSNFMPISWKTSEYYMQFYSIDPTKTYLQTLFPFRMEKVSTNDTFQIKVYKGELIVRSLFNFLCYYQLATEIRWTLLLNQNYTLSNNESQRFCNATITLKNQNFMKTYSIQIKNTDPVQNRAYMPWIFRSFYILLCIVSLAKLRLHIKHKNMKLYKMKYNLISNDFEFKVRINTKKQVQHDAGSEISDFSQLDHHQKHDN